MNRKVIKNITDILSSFNPNDAVQYNGKFIGLPFDLQSAQIVFYPVPWDCTSSSSTSSCFGPQSILHNSVEIDLFDENVPDAWKLGHYFLAIDEVLFEINDRFKIQKLQLGNPISSSSIHGNREGIDIVNIYSKSLHQKIYRDCLSLINFGKLTILVGGDHSTAFGNIKACQDCFPNMDILQVDAHFDTRKGFESYHYSHASIFYNVFEEIGVNRLHCIGIRDYCQEEYDFYLSRINQINLLTAQDLRFQLLEGNSYSKIIKSFVSNMANEVYISLDIDGLEIYLASETGTPVPGGLTYYELLYLVKTIVDSGRKIVGMDICEVSGSSQNDAFVAAKLAFHLSNLMAKSNDLAPY